MQNLLKQITNLPAYAELKHQLINYRGEQAVFGLVGTHKTALIASLVADFQSVAIIIANEEKQALAWQEDLQLLLPDWEVCYFPNADIKIQKVLLADSHDTTKLRLHSLYQLRKKKRVVVLTTIEAAMNALPEPRSFEQLTLMIATGGQLDQRKLISHLITAGYRRTTQVESLAQFSIRGDIVDIYPPLAPYPIRIEFYGDEIDSLRYFDLSDQRTIEVVESAEITPATDYFWSTSEMSKGVKLLASDIERIGKDNPDHPMLDRWNYDLEILREGSGAAGLEQYSMYLAAIKTSLFEYPLQKPLIIWDEPARLHEIANLRHQEIIQDSTLLPRQKDVLYSYSHLVYEANTAGKMVTIALLSRQVSAHKPINIHTFAARQAPAFHGQLPFLMQELKNWLKQRYSIILISNNVKNSTELVDYMQAENVDTVEVTEIPPTLIPGQVLVTNGVFRQGFEIPELRLIVLTEQEIFGSTQRVIKKRKTEKVDNRKKLTDYRELQIGDYVVHVSHGIGVYQGIKTMEINNVHSDYLAIRYKGEDRLYVPVDQIHLVQKYIGSEGKAPKIYSLGNNEWQRVKSRVKASVQEMAKELLALYAKREAVVGITYPLDDKWQQEFENSFPFDETPDQLKAISEMKKDMHSPQPMDRLLCGDVGYGKTEVALRGAFKAAMHGKQVAILVPTTILAHQHYRTFRSRLSQYPLNIAMLSRFRSRKENQKTSEGLRQGTVDIVIGTHALLQDSISFKDLGLLVIDEEQRFGVRHKERIKQLKENVDVITLSATPIPRTLHMAMVGMRDLSMIETPPENRYPVQTYVIEYEPSLVRECIQRELNRDGQVYYLHNRVKDIEHVAEKLQKLLPEARIAVGHGRMSERHLEQMMIDFYNYEYDILVSTTIIESGLDIPNVNTLIVEDADKFGLSQLYQLRGRVGRSNRIAYAYLTYQKNKVLSEVAEKRLNAIREFTELGAGFKIALRDLQIRGAGNILGPEQSGFMMQVGYDLYVQLLDEALKELKGETVDVVPDVDININIDAYIPNRYISDNKVKIEMYKKIVNCRHQNDVQDITDELLDRFGDPPLPVRHLLLISEVRAALSYLGAISIKRRKENFIINFALGTVITPIAIQELWKTHGSQLELKPGNEMGLEIATNCEEHEVQLKLVSKILYDLIELITKS